MMKTDAYYLASKEVAQRGGLFGLRYIAPDGRIILSESDLRIMANKGVFTPEEFVTGLDVEIISSERAKLLISEGHYRMNEDDVEVDEEESEEPAEESPEEEEQEETNNETEEDE